MNAMGVLGGLLGVALLVAPLERMTTLGLGRGPWNAWELFLGGVFLGAWLVVWRQRAQVPQRLLWGCLAASVFFTAVAALSAVPGAAWDELIRILLIVWTVPLIAALREANGKRLLLALLILVACIHAVWGVGQFAIQRGFGWVWVGEVELSAAAPGVAKFAGAQEEEMKIVRAYGPFTHANQYGGTLVIGLLAVVFLVRKFAAPLRGFVFLSTPLLVLGGITSFSRAAAIGMVLVSTLFLYGLRRMNTRLQRSLLVVISVVFFVFVPLWHERISDSEDAAVPERVQGMTWALDLLAEQPVWRGTGMGSYEEVLRTHLDETGTAYAEWQIAPVHSVPVLAAVEWGIVWAGLFFGTVLWWLRKHLGLVLALTPLLLFDHYLVTETGPLLGLVTLLVSLPHRETGLARVQPVLPPVRG